MGQSLLQQQGFQKRLLCHLLNILLFIYTFSTNLAADELNPYQVKAVYLFNFSKFVTWPKSSLSQPDFTICILGKDPFGVYLDLTLEDTQTTPHPIHARRIQNLNQLSHCPLLFISTSEQGRLSEILAITTHQAILTVSDIPDFAKRGGCIELYNTQRKINLIINLTSVKHAGLSIRANLLQLSKIIR